ncbi:MAG: carboxypeptidase-like regulatory domain-containing protein, partial [Bacteroidota bacterium]|nr:carboxypeptidase-like regulatory domain-containing protein [Bacteroidota bacterium]
MKRIATLILALGFSLAALAQNVTLKGTVVDSDNQPVIGAFVVEQGTSNGAMTGIDGDFALTTRQGAPIEITCIGYATQVVVNNGAQNLVIVLEDDAQILEETVV